MVAVGGGAVIVVVFGIALRFLCLMHSCGNCCGQPTRASSSTRLQGPTAISMPPPPERVSTHTASATPPPTAPATASAPAQPKSVARNTAPVHQICNMFSEMSARRSADAAGLASDIQYERLSAAWGIFSSTNHCLQKASEKPFANKRATNTVLSYM